MSVSTALIPAESLAEVRRYVNEPTTAVYDDVVLNAIIAKYAYNDIFGVEPLSLQTSATSLAPPVLIDNPAWLPTFDLHAAAAQIWQEKASTVAMDYSFSADGGSYSRNQVYEQYMKQSRYHSSRKAVRGIPINKGILSMTIKYEDRGQI